MQTDIAKPFLKWAGGKSQLLDNIRMKYIDRIDSYCEPFVGGGAVLFDILNYKKPKRVLINDINDELINTYILVRDNVNELIFQLTSIQEEYWNIPVNKKVEYYLNKRREFNEIKFTDSDNLRKAVLFVFLNKTCFNGLYRVNANGFFNVPIGKQSSNPLICDADNLRAVSNVLANITIKCGDFYDCLEFIDKDTFVYLDPPYRPLTKTSSFNSYDNHKFDDDEQVRLYEFIKEANEVGANIVLSNSDPKNIDTNDNFFDDLYHGFEIQRIEAKRMINSNGDKRGNITELLISNY